MLMLDSDTFNHKMIWSQVKLVQCLPAMVGFSFDKINILHHIKHLFSTVMLASRALDGMDMIHHNQSIIHSTFAD